jgi:hypothetical protein
MREYGLEMNCILFVMDSPNEIRNLLEAHTIHCYEREVIIVRLKSLDNLNGILRCLKAREISFLHVHGLIMNAENQTDIILMVDDLAADIEMLARSSYQILEQGNLSR